ncbi:MAG TPA: beta-ribofuranosylaminobenzene 5'-phosphate synthase family protein [Gemmataceae bacterium]|nr:beta-ribofuranosylaminobenzene 5'-phosphate synthase family protein [Gemmataceae bacterium]
MVCIIYTMIRVQAPSRLHFGLLSLSSDTHWPNLLGEEAVPSRHFGGAGVMIEQPGIVLTAQPADDWAAEGVLAERALEDARRFAQTWPAHVLRPHRLVIERSAPAHVGLGTGTQLGLAVARALCISGGLPDLTTVDLARRVGRGMRSGVGVHGFAQGGFVVEAGQRPGGRIAPLVARTPCPEDWRWVVVLPPWGAGLHGQEEREAFRRLDEQHMDLETTGHLCRLLMLGMLPALQERDLDGFGESLFDFNRRVGQSFATVQSGPYASSPVADLVSFIHRQGVHGVGQSSWGPAVFAVADGAERAEDLAQRIREHFGLQAEEVLVTAACNHGAVVL